MTRKTPSKQTFTPEFQKYRDRVRRIGPAAWAAGAAVARHPGPARFEFEEAMQQPDPATAVWEWFEHWAGHLETDASVSLEVELEASDLELFADMVVEAYRATPEESEDDSNS